MRYRGQRLPLDVVQGAPAAEGWLHVRTVPWRPYWLPARPLEPTSLATLTERHDDGPSLFPELHGVYVHQLEANQLTLVGFETLTEHGHPVVHRQTWWCRSGAARLPERPAVVDEGGDLLGYSGDE